jgi:hypothetical protein
MTGIGRMLNALEHAWQEITFAGILQIPFPRFIRHSAPRRANSTAA